MRATPHSLCRSLPFGAPSKHFTVTTGAPRLSKERRTVPCRRRTGRVQAELENSSSSGSSNSSSSSPPSDDAEKGRSPWPRHSRQPRPSPFVDSWADLPPPERVVPPKAKEPRPTRGRPRPEEVKQKIKASLKGRLKGVPKTDEHKANIRRAMLRKMNRDSTHRLKISASAKGKPKVCKLCGTAGHNSRTCPLNLTARAASKLKAEAAAAQRTRKKGSRHCGICGQPGHYRSTCPQAATSQSSQPEGMEPNTAEDVLSVAPPAEATHPSEPVSSQAKTVAQGEAAVAVGRPEVAHSHGYAPLKLPRGRGEMCDAAVAAAGAAFRDGIRFQRVELSLERSSEGLDAESWAGGIRQQFSVALPLVERVLGGLKQTEGLRGRMSAELVDEADAVGCWQNDSFAAMLFPTADTLGRLRELCARKGERLVVVLNPQWQGEGQVISDFGFGRARRDAEDFVESFQPTFCFRNLRLMGQNVVLYKCYPGLWQLHVMNRYGAGECLGADPSEPSYRRIEDLVRRHKERASDSWLERVRSGNIWQR